MCSLLEYFQLIFYKRAAGAAEKCTQLYVPVYMTIRIFKVGYPFLGMGYHLPPPRIPLSVLGYPFLRPRILLENFACGALT